MERNTKHFKTDCVFHENVLDRLEDCIEQSNLSDTQKEELSTILYRDFFHITKKNAINWNYKIVQLET